MTEKQKAAYSRLQRLKAGKPDHVVYAYTDENAVRYPYERLIQADKALVYDAMKNDRRK